MNKGKQQGVTLVELVIAMSIIAIAIFGIISVFKLTITSSANPITRKQAVLISDSLMEEVLSKSFSKPSGGFAGPFTANNREQFDSVSDYNGISINGITTIAGNTIPGLENYSANIMIENKAVGLISSTNILMATIIVSGPNDTFVLKGFKFND